MVMPLFLPSSKPRSARSVLHMMNQSVWNRQLILDSTDTKVMPTTSFLGMLKTMSLSDQQLLDALSRMPFVESTELALILGEPHATVHRALTGLLADGIVGRVSHGTAHLPSSRRYYLMAHGIGEAAGILGFDTPSDFVRAYPVSREWLTLLTRRMDAVASIYRLAASMSPGIDGLRSRVEFHRRGRFDATITLHDGRSFGVLRQGLSLRRRSLYDRLRAIARVRLQPSSRHRSGPGSECLGGEADDEVLR